MTTDPVSEEMREQQPVDAQQPNNEPAAFEEQQAASTTEPSPSAADRTNDNASVQSSMSKTTENPSFVGLPQHLKPLAKQIRKLAPEDLLTISEVTQKVTQKDIYSLLPYTGSNWYLPEIRTVGEQEARWGISYSLDNGLQITMGGRCLKIHVIGVVLRLSILVLIWYVLYNILGKELMTPGGYVWDPLVTFVVASIVGGTVCRFLQVPPLLGVLWIGIMWHNIPELGFLTEGIYKDVIKIAQRVGLTVVLARAGFSLSLKAIKPHFLTSILLASLPYGFEVMAHGLSAHKIFGYSSYQWSFLQATICSTVSPAIVVPGVLFLQEQGYGQGYGPLSLLLSAVSLEVCFGVWAANFIIGLLFNSTPLAVAIVLGPVQIIGGVIIGILCGILFHYFVEIIKTEAARLPSGKYAAEHIDDVMSLSFFVFLLLNLLCVFLGYSVKLAGGGAVAAVFFSATVAHMWVKDGDRELESHKVAIGRRLASTWDLVVMPALFSMVGVTINLKAIFNSTFFPKAIAVIGISTAVRATIIFLVTLTAKLSFRERLLAVGGYLGKATAQAAIGPMALANVKTLIAANGIAFGDLVEQKEMSENILYVSLLYVLVMAPIAALSLVKGGPMVLTKQQTRR